jgi:hypothetical protein
LSFSVRPGTQRVPQESPRRHGRCPRHSHPLQRPREAQSEPRFFLPAFALPPCPFFLFPCPPQVCRFSNCICLTTPPPRKNRKVYRFSRSAFPTPSAEDRQGPAGREAAAMRSICGRGARQASGSRPFALRRRRRRRNAPQTVRRKTQPRAPVNTSKGLAFR